MVDWKLIMGVIPPYSEEGWVNVFEQYKQFPQFKILNYEMSLEEFKSIFLWEYVHRMWGRLIGLAFIIPFLIFLFQKKINALLLKNLLVLFILGATQGLLGWWMVKSGLIDKPWVSPYRLTAHLLLATILFALTFHLGLNLYCDKTVVEIKVLRLKRLRQISLILIIIFFVQLSYGGLMAGLKAGLFYPTFPKIKGQWIPDGMWMMEPLWRNLFENITTVQFFHRTIGILLGIATISFVLYSRKKLANNTLEKVNYALLAVVTIQIILGIFTLLNAVPIALAALHQAFALLLLTCLLYMHNRISLPSNRAMI